MILAGDVGGTKTYLGLFEIENGRAQIVRSGAYRTHDYPRLQDMLKDFVPAGTEITCASFGVPGPVVNGEVLLTNVSWTLTEEELRSALHVPVSLINDLVATGIGIGVLPTDKLLTLSEGVDPIPGTIALIAAGTGLGESILYWNGSEHTVQPCEGGQADFAPHDDIQIELLRYMRRELAVVCVERVLSGPGLASIYRFLRDTGRGVELPHIAEQIRHEDPASVIGSAATKGECPMAKQALDIFLSIYGSEAGNLALRAVSVGGIYIGGGIASRIAPQLANGIFMKSFVEKDLMGSFMKQIPVKVILDDRTGLYGAAQYAFNHHLSVEHPV
jgi:glucokinase